MIALRPVPIGHDKAAFHRYFDDFSSALDEQHLLSQLADCRDPLPPRYADGLGLLATATYRDAVRLLLVPWQPTGRAAPSAFSDEL